MIMFLRKTVVSSNTSKYFFFKTFKDTYTNKTNYLVALFFFSFYFHSIILIKWYGYQLVLIVLHPISKAGTSLGGGSLFILYLL